MHFDLLSTCKQNFRWLKIWDFEKDFENCRKKNSTLVSACKQKTVFFGSSLLLDEIYCVQHLFLRLFLWRKCLDVIASPLACYIARQPAYVLRCGWYYFKILSVCTGIFITGGQKNVFLMCGQGQSVFPRPNSTLVCLWNTMEGSR